MTELTFTHITIKRGTVLIPAGRGVWMSVSNNVNSRHTRRQPRNRARTIRKSDNKKVSLVYLSFGKKGRVYIAPNTTPTTPISWDDKTLTMGFTWKGEWETSKGSTYKVVPFKVTFERPAEYAKAKAFFGVGD